MHLFIIGAPASGKMTIGQELSRLTDATLFYNHQAIDFALEIYQDYTEEMWEFVRGITFSFLGASARNQRSVILTDVIDFSNQYHLIYLKHRVCWMIIIKRFFLLSWKQVLKSAYVEIERRID
ncbi:shikimate kinase [Streptococcus pneumoniae]|nr:shikimate kinase [Streptococcus pneumoniae]